MKTPFCRCDYLTKGSLFFYQFFSTVRVFRQALSWIEEDHDNLTNCVGLSFKNKQKLSNLRNENFRYKIQGLATVGLAIGAVGLAVRAATRQK